MPQPSRDENDARRHRLIRGLAPAMISVDRAEIRRAPYAIAPDIPDAQEKALIDHALELGGPPGTIIGRQIATRDGHSVEIVLGWERLEAFTHRDAFPHSPTLPIGLIQCNDADAAFYAIEYAQLNQKAAGLVSSPLCYASAAQAAIDHFSQPEKPWAIQTLANALCIARPTLSNRLRLLNGLTPTTRDLLQSGKIKPEFAKILLAAHSPAQQEHLARQASRGGLSSRALYQRVHPNYAPPKTVSTSQERHPQNVSDVNAMERALTERYGTSATIAFSDGYRSGVVELPFHSLSALKGLLESLDHQIETDTLLRGTLTLHADQRRTIDDLLRELGANTDPALE